MLGKYKIFVVFRVKICYIIDNVTARPLEGVGIFSFMAVFVFVSCFIIHLGALVYMLPNG